MTDSTAGDRALALIVEALPTLMIGWRKKKEEATLPPGLRVYAIGDIHGRLDLFEALIAKLEADHRARPPMEVDIILLGDLIDRERWLGLSEQPRGLDKWIASR